MDDKTTSMDDKTTSMDDKTSSMFNVLFLLVVVTTQHPVVGAIIKKTKKGGKYSFCCRIMRIFVAC